MSPLQEAFEDPSTRVGFSKDSAMNNVKQLSRESAALAVIDMQEAFRSVMPDFGDVASRIAKAVDGAKLLEVPVIVTEQYPKGLKHTAKEILARLPHELAAIEKSCFSSCGAEDFLAQLASRHIKQVLVCGIEAHICVLQTSLDLLANGFEVYLVVDCITSRAPENKQVALARMMQAGAIECTLEMALFEMMRTADSPQFKAIQNLIK
jgi:nicotinamidase-related amidase